MTHMQVLCSRLDPSGAVVVVRLPDAAAFYATYLDDGSTRNITAHTANLLLTAALDRIEKANDPPLDTDDVEAVTVAYASRLSTLEVPSFTWLNAPAGEAGDFGSDDVLELLAQGLSVELTAAVAFETAATEIPDDASSLDS